ncbi:hypothetical protein [Bradyrhizobium sp. SYSU BS000235]|uniref:hypothetical protein n=1 Tax=Bradyrhizobium sp. SYSU BS000235 TaxID=3411332 RepID=UPI003C78C128
MDRSDPHAPVDHMASDPRLGVGGNNPPPDFSLKDLVDGLAARLDGDHTADMTAEIEAIAKRANDEPTEFATDEDLAKATDIVNDAVTAFDKYDGIRKDEKDQYLKGGKIVDDYFRSPLQRLTRIKETFTDRATKYRRDQKRKADAEAAAERDRLAKIAEENRIAAETAAAFGDEGEASARTDIAESLEARMEDVTPTTVETIRGSSGGSARGRTEWTYEILDFQKVDLNAIRAFIAPDAIEKALKQMAKTQKHLAKVEGVRFFEDDKVQFTRR